MFAGSTEYAAVYVCRAGIVTVSDDGDVGVSILYTESSDGGGVEGTGRIDYYASVVGSYGVCNSVDCRGSVGVADVYK